MLKRILLIAIIGVVLLGGAVAAFVFRTPESASTPIEALPIATTVATNVAESSAPASETSAAATVFEIVPTESQARFLVDEVLRGSPVTVVGSTNQVAGQIAIDPADPAASQVGAIQVNARTLATDSESRNRALKNVILDSNSHEFITFTPAAVTGLPATGAVGETYSFQMTGDLTIKGVTRTVTFDVSVTPVSAERIEGSASTTVLYRDFELTIPDSPAVDTVADEVRLELEFVAQAA